MDIYDLGGAGAMLPTGKSEDNSVVNSLLPLWFSRIELQTLGLLKKRITY